MVNLLAFLVGLAIGLSLWAWQYWRFTRRLRSLLQTVPKSYAIEPTPSPETLSRAIAQYGKVRSDLEHQLEGYRQILQSAPLGFLQVDDENRLIWCNAQSRQMLHIPHSDYSKPRLLLEIVRSYELDQLIEQTRDAGKPCQKEWTFYPVSADASQLFHQSSYVLRGYGFPLPQEQVGIFLENRQEAITLLQQRDRWASDVAHELKTPLTSIRLVAETLQGRLEPPLRNWVDRLIHETVRLSNLVQDVLDLSQIERGSFHSLHLGSVDLPQLVHSAWTGLEPLAQPRGIRLNYRGPAHFPIQGDEARLYRVFINLLDNSIKFSPSQHVIQVRLSSIPPAAPPPNWGEDNGSSLHEQVCLEVIDAGSGFSEEDLPYVFERFYRADPSRSRIPPGGSSVSATPAASPIEPPSVPPKPSVPSSWTGLQHSGSGLGLSIVKQIVEAHAGTVWAGNHPETGGGWLRVYLPCSQEALPPVPRPVQRLTS